MSFFILVALIVVIWLLWTLCRNTGDALDKQTALQYEIVALEKRIEQLIERFPEPSAAAFQTKAPAAKTSTKTATTPRKRPVKKAAPAETPAPGVDDTPTSQ